MLEKNKQAKCEPESHIMGFVYGKLFITMTSKLSLFPRPSFWRHVTSNLSKKKKNESLGTFDSDKFQKFLLIIFLF